MSDFYKFAGEHPWLTFILFVVVCECIARVFEALF